MANVQEAVSVMEAFGALRTCASYYKNESVVLAAAAMLIAAPIASVEDDVTRESMLMLAEASIRKAVSQLRG